MKQFSEKQIVSIWNHKMAKICVVKRDIASNCVKATIRGFSGIQTIARFALLQERTIQIDFALLTGVAELAFVDGDKNIVAKIKSSEHLVTLPAGKYRLRFLGEHADADLIIR